jgi:uncharacterized protein YecT (DUF1311 family)
MEAKMRRVGLIAALALAWAAQWSPVRADPFESYREESLLNCVAPALNDADALRRCIGAGANPCIVADGSATSSHVLCWSHEADSWRALMQQAIGELKTGQTSRDPQRLERANAAWNAWAEAECEYWAWEEGGGSGEQVDRVQCLAQMTAERAISLLVAGDSP